MARIALDASYSVGSELTGIGRYSRRLTEELIAQNPVDVWLLCYRPKQWLKADRPRSGNVRKRLLQPPLPLGRPGLFHALNQRVDGNPSRRVVSTFHDLFVMTAEYSSAEFRARFEDQARRAAVKSDLVIAVSAYTASQVEELLRIPRQRIRIVPHGVDPPRRVPHGKRENIVLAVGAIQKRKNLARLVEAFESLSHEWRLVLAGDPGGFGGPDVLGQVERSQARARIDLAGYVDAATLEDLYFRSSIVAFPSLDEGFGIPVLEAMAHGVPVLTSNRSALPEVAGEAALLVDPFDTDQIAEGLQRMAADQQLRDQLTRAGLKRAAEFSWRRAAKETYAVYRELL